MSIFIVIIIITFAIIVALYFILKKAIPAKPPVIPQTPSNCIIVSVQGSGNPGSIITFTTPNDFGFSSTEFSKLHFSFFETNEEGTTRGEDMFKDENESILDLKSVTNTVYKKDNSGEGI